MKNNNKEEYIKAKSIVDSYERKLNSALVIDKTCCVCKTTKVVAYNKEFIDPLNQERGMWKGGTVEKISFGFGSNHDTKVYYIAICDSCLDNLYANKLAQPLEEVRKEIKNIP